MIRPPPPRPIDDPRPTVPALLADPSVRSPLKAVLRTWAGRDPIDAAQDADLLALAPERVADEVCGRLHPPAPLKGSPAPAADYTLLAETGIQVVGRGRATA